MIDCLGLALIVKASPFLSSSRFSRAKSFDLFLENSSLRKVHNVKMISLEEMLRYSNFNGEMIKLASKHVLKSSQQNL